MRGGGIRDYLPSWLGGIPTSVSPATPPNTGVSGAMASVADTLKQGVVDGATALNDNVVKPATKAVGLPADGKAISDATGTTPPTGGKTITGGKRHRKTRRRR